MRSFPILCSAVLLIGLHWQCEAEAQRNPALEAAPPGAADQIVARWTARLSRIEASLVDGEAEAAYKAATRLLQEMNDGLISGDAVGNLLGMATALRAVAAVKLGRGEEGVWHWVVAQQLFPGVTQLPIEAHGVAGRYLRRHQPRASAVSFDGAHMPIQLTKQPEKIRAPSVEFPEARRGAGLEVRIVVQAVVGIDGRLRDPLILQSAGELTLVFATLDAIRSWQFRPGEIDGEPVPALFSLVANFKS